MEKYYSVTLCRKGYCSAYNAIYKKDPSSRVFILSDGNDFERAVFFKKLSKNLRGYSISLFNPFYDEAADGIYIKSLNTYILSDGGYNRISPLLPGEWEKAISIAPPKGYPVSLRREVLLHKSLENDFYKKASKALESAGEAREKIHAEISRKLDDEKLINFLRRFCTRTFRDTAQKGSGTVRLLSSATPLGTATHWDTVFDNTETVVNFCDKTSFVNSVILGIIKDYAAREKVPFLMSPSYYIGEIPQFLIFPTLSLAVTAEDSSHTPPFSPAHTVNSSRFLKDCEDDEKTSALLDIEKKLLDRCVLNLYEGREERFKYNDLVKDYSDFNAAKKAADELTERIVI